MIVAAGLAQPRQRAYRLWTTSSHEATAGTPSCCRRTCRPGGHGDRPRPDRLQRRGACRSACPDRRAAPGLCDPDEPGRAARPSPSPSPATSGCWAVIVCCCGDATKAEDVGRLMAGQRAALMATDPPYWCGLHRRQPPPDLEPGRPARSARAKTKHWDDYRDAAHSASFYADFLRVALDVRPESPTGDLHLLCHDARARGLCRLERGRPAGPPGGRLAEDARRAEHAAIHVGLRAAALRLGQGPPAASPAPPAGGCHAPSGRSLGRSKTARAACTPPRSRSSSCAGRSSYHTARRRAASTSPSPARARPSSPPR